MSAVATLPAEPARRTIPARRSAWATGIADRCVRARISADRMSVWGLISAASAGVILVIEPHAGRLGAVACVVAAIAVQLRLLANMLDGMIADRVGSTPRGALFNEIPDRISDVVILTAAGCAIGSAGVALGLIAALAALATAYARGTASLVGVIAPFSGPMAKPQRMMVLTGALLIAAAVPGLHNPALVIALVAIAVGSLITAVRRTVLIARQAQ